MRTIRPSSVQSVRNGHRAATLSAPAPLFVALVLALAPMRASAETFDFDTAPIHSSLPISLTVGAVTAHFHASGSGFSIQPANTMGFTPAGFGGLCIYPNSVYAADLLISFDQTLTDFSMLYAPQELACDSSAIMRITAYMGTILVGSNLTTAPVPGTWPTGTLAFSSTFGFNNVVLHYERGPGSGGDWGPIFMADNMSVTTTTTSVPAAGPGTTQVRLGPNPATSVALVRIELTRAGPLTVTVHDAAGRLLRTLVSDASAQPGLRTVEWDGCDEAGFPVESGVYFCRVQAPAGPLVKQIVIRR